MTLAEAPRCATAGLPRNVVSAAWVPPPVLALPLPPPPPRWELKIVNSGPFHLLFIGAPSATGLVHGILSAAPTAVIYIYLYIDTTAFLPRTQPLFSLRAGEEGLGDLDRLNAQGGSQGLPSWWRPFGAPPRELVRGRDLAQGLYLCLVLKKGVLRVPHPLRSF